MYFQIWTYLTHQCRMKSLLLYLFLFSSSTIVANNDSIPKEKSRSSPARNRRLPVARTHRDVLPKSDSPFGNLPIARKRIPETTPEMHDAPRVDNLSTEGRIAEDELANPWVYTNTKRYLNRWYRNITGFRVFTDYGTTIGFGKDYNIRGDLYMTFGYQFNPIYYLGVGQGYSLSLNSQESSAPSFVNARINFLDENTTPFFDLKGGYSFVEGKGLYLNPNIGLSFGKNKRAWNISAGYSLQKAKVQYKGTSSSYNYHGVVLKVSYEFSVFK